MSGIMQFLNLMGGLGIFLIGMRIMSDGIHKRSGSRLKSVLHTLTNNRFGGVLTGMGVTGIIQSSSATTVLLVSLVNAGLVTLNQSIGVVMGANIGTTLTAWIVSIVGFKFKITNFALPAIAVAIPLYFSKFEKRRDISEILIGFGLLFLGLHLMKENVPDISKNPEALQFLTNLTGMGFGSILLFVFIGTVITVVLQSSSAAMTLTITMAFKGWISFPVAAAIVLGENIGTTVTAFLASIPMNASAKRTARAHMVFNLIGVLWMLVVFYPFTALIERFVPGSVADPNNIPIHLSAFHTSFNILNTLILIGFVPAIGKLVTKMIPEKKHEAALGTYTLALVPSNLPDATDSNLIGIRHELSKMATIIHDMLMMVLDTSQDLGKVQSTKSILETKEQYIDDMREEITHFLTECTRESMSDYQAKQVQSMQRVVHELESIADSCYSIILHMDQLFKKKLSFHKKGPKELFEYISHVLDFIKFNEDYLTRKIKDYDLGTAIEMEDQIDKMRDKLNKSSRSKMAKKKRSEIRAELIFRDIVRHLEHIGDYSLNVSQAMKELD